MAQPRDNTPCLDVIADFSSVPPLGRFGNGAFNDVCGSSESAAAPIVCGIWYPDDVENGSDVVEIVVDEVKYVIAGESTWECATTGRKFHASTGSMIWLPKNCKVIRRYSKGLKTFYVEQDYRKPTSLEDPGTAYLARLDALYISGETAFRSANPKSLGLHQARLVEFKTNGTLHPSSSSGQFPLFMERGSGYSVVSVDGTDYLDFSYDPSAGVIGHANPELLDSLRTALETDTNLGDATSKEVQLARALKARFRSLEALRFCVLQTEAVAIALSLAVNATSKNKIMTFRPGHITTSSHDLVAASYNDMESVSKQLSSDVAAILVEPLQCGATGVRLATKDFLQFLRVSAARVGALLIFDETSTSQLHTHGLEQHFSVFPDLTILGGHIGGGFPLSVVGGRQDVMAHLGLVSGVDQSLLTPQNRTNLAAAAAGLAVDRIMTEERIARMNQLGDQLRDGINSAATGYTTRLVSATGFASLVGLEFQGPASERLQKTFFLYMLEKGIHIGLSPFISVSVAHTAESVRAFLEAFKLFLSEVLSGRDWAGLIA